MRSYNSLSDHDFELLVADLLGAELGVTFEVFARGPDQGVDLRHLRDAEPPDIVQCKHMLGSSYSKLKSSALKEARVLSALGVASSSYRFVTSRPLSANAKRELAKILARWVLRDDHVYGADDLEGLLNRHEDVERAHVKLWLSSVAQLDERVHAATWARSRQLFEEIRDALPRYVETGAFWSARRRLRQERVLVISGPPGIGKTTLARLLLADAVRDGYEPVEISADIEEANEVIRRHGKPQIFYYDDFLGSTFLQDRLAKNEDKRLTAFMRRCAGSDRVLFVLATREHILAQAAQWYEELHLAGLPLRRFLLELAQYTRWDRARIFYNHVWHSGQLSTRARALLLQDANYSKIIDHPNYNPRLVEYVTGLASKRISDDENADYVRFAIEILDNPDLIWQRAFERQLDEDCRDLLIALASMPTEATLEDVSTAYHALAGVHGRKPSRGAYRDALMILDDSFTRSRERAQETFIMPANPSVQDFVAAWLADRSEEAVAAIDGCAFFEQLRWFDRKVLPLIASGGREGVAKALARATQRCWSSRNPGWSDVYWDDEATPRFTRNDSSPEQRLIFVVSGLHENPDYEAMIRVWLLDQLVALERLWLDVMHYVRDPSVVVSLVEALKKARLLRISTAAAAREALRKHSPYAYKWSQLARLRDLVPEVFPPAVQLEITSALRKHVSEALDPDSGELQSRDELYDLRRAAGRFGVDVSEEKFEDALHWVEDGRPEEEGEVRDDGLNLGTDRMSRAEEDAAIRELFGRLAEPDDN